MCCGNTEECFSEEGLRISQEKSDTGGGKGGRCGSGGCSHQNESHVFRPMLNLPFQIETTDAILWRKPNKTKQKNPNFCFLSPAYSAGEQVWQTIAL